MLDELPAEATVCPQGNTRAHLPIILAGKLATSDCPGRKPCINSVLQRGLIRLLDNESLTDQL